MREIKEKVIRTGHIRSSILQVNLTVMLLVLGVFMTLKIRFPFLIFAALTMVFAVVVVATIWTLYEKLMRGVLERVDEVGIYGIGYEEEFVKQMSFELEMLIMTLVLFGLFLFNATGTGTAGEILHFLKVVWWFAMFINVFQLIFWLVRQHLLKKTR